MLQGGFYEDLKQKGRFIANLPFIEYSERNQPCEPAERYSLRASI